MYRHLLLDLDETLYGPETGVWLALRERIHRYMTERLGLSAERATELRRHYFLQYGTSLAGLHADFAINADDYLAYVHDLPLETMLPPNPALNGMLARLPLTKSILTNADAAHAQRVLRQLNITHHFTHLIDIRALGFINKPRPEAYQRALQLLNAQPEECIFADDALRNLQTAHALGLVTVLVGGEAPAPQSGADYHIPTILGLERVVAGLLGQVY